MPTPPAPPTAVSRQRRWQLAQQAAGRCPHCGGPPAAGYVRCELALEQRREQKRAARRAKEER